MKPDGATQGGPTCSDDMRLLVQADIDGELTTSESARVAIHLDTCSDCAELQTRLLALSSRLREVPRFPLPQTLHGLINAPAPQPARTRAAQNAAPFAAGLALAASIAIFLLPARQEALPAFIVTAHIRALQPGHLMDVVSTDQHTVKPWFDGKLPFAPPVKDFAREGAPLQGGRLDYIAGHTASALVYGYGKHVIEVFAWPDPGTNTSASGESQGYNYENWHADNMTFWAVSDLNRAELRGFIRKFQS